MSSLVGRTLGPFRILEELDAGGQGMVYRARDERLGWDVALKVLAPGLLGDETSRRRLEVEARALASVDHPSVVVFHGLGCENGLDFLIMELVAGESLDRRIARGPLEESELLDLGLQLASGIAAAHAKGVLHRDLKPKNLMITPEGRLKILDFGLAKLAQGTHRQALTVEDTVPGTLHYLAPELFNGAIADQRSDVYALGLVLYEAATGGRRIPRAPDAATGKSSSNAALEPPRPPGRRLKPALEALILQCIDTRPEARPVSATALAERMRGIANPPRIWRELRVAAIVVVSLGLAIAAYLIIREPIPLLDSQLHSWAVLPLTGAADDSDQAYLAEGVAAELADELASVPSIRVISHESSRRYGPSRPPIRQIARELGARGLVTGDLRVARDHVRIGVQLVDGRDDHVLWSDTFEGSPTDVAALQHRVDVATFRRVQHFAGQGSRGLSSSRAPNESAAYSDYLRARYYWDRRPAELFRSIEYFESAIRTDSLYALAYAGLADAWAAVGLYGLRPPLETRRMARAAARRAVTLDDKLSNAHDALAQVLHNYEWDWDGAEAEYRRALALNPNDASAHHGLAHLLAQQGRGDEALREIRTAVALNPRVLPSVVAVAVMKYYARDYAGALDTLQRVADLDTLSALRHRLAATILDRLGRRDEAMHELARAVELQGQPALAQGLRATNSARGLEPTLQLLIGALIQKRASGAYEPAEHVAELYSRLGRVEEALQWLETAYIEHDTELNRLKVDPIFDPLRHDPRFAQLMRRVGLT